MTRITLKADTLNQENRRFEQQPLLHPVFLNSLPKSGSHLLRNIVRMFVPVSQQYQKQFVQHVNMNAHLAAFDPDFPLLSWGHLPFSDAAGVAVSGLNKILLVRDPYSWVLARARFFVSDEVQGDDYKLIKSGKLNVDEIMNLMIFGIHGHAPSLLEMYTHHIVSWLGTGVYLVRYEDLVRHVQDIGSAAAAQYFDNLFEACRIAVPTDWDQRVTIGADPSQSGTARGNLTIKAVTFPHELPALQRSLVDYATPGLRNILGYTDCDHGG